MSIVGSGAFIDLRQSGLRCRADGCLAVFRRRGDGTNLDVLQLAAADRAEHELHAHGLRSEPRLGLTGTRSVAVARRTVAGDGASRVIPSARRQLLELLYRKGPASSAELTDELEQRDSEVRRHLKVLIAADLVRTELNRRNPGPGRPRFRYALTSDAITLVSANANAALRDLLIDARAVGGEKLIHQILELRVGRLAERYRNRFSGSLRERVDAMLVILEEHGAEIQLGQVDELTFILVERDGRILNVDRSGWRICAYQLELLRRLLRVSVTQDEDGGHGPDTCVYLIQAPRHAEGEGSTGACAAGTDTRPPVGISEAAKLVSAER